MDSAGGAGLPEGQGSDEASERPDADAEAARQKAQLAGIERDLDTVDTALSALDADDLEGAEALADELDEPDAGSPTRAAEPDERDAAP